ncbi:UNVERIFIED_CONTAM: cytochrome [Sesamum radiatum]|uniref:Cytochrome n=1 Tax=Sesamum radiatum TaxID=300843 RepID=A0AAW2RF49_SESRA
MALSNGTAHQSTDMEFSSAFYAAIAFFLLLYYYLLYSRSTKPTTQKSKSPPEAGGAWAFTGHLHLMNGGSSAGLPHINLAALADKYGPVFTIRIGVRRVLVREQLGTCQRIIHHKRRRNLLPSKPQSCQTLGLRLRHVRILPVRPILARAAQADLRRAALEPQA